MLRLDTQTTAGRPVLLVVQRRLFRMTTDPQTVAWLDQEDANLAQLVRAHRWAVQYVGEGDGPDEPPFGYTVGLFGLGHPELALVGLAPESTPPPLGRVADMIGDGRALVP